MVSCATVKPRYITVPAYPNVVFKGIVNQVRVNPTTVQNVVTYDAVVIVHDEQERLKPGMTANVTIDVVHRSKRADGADWPRCSIDLGSTRYRRGLAQIGGRGERRTRASSSPAACGGRARLTRDPVGSSPSNKPVATPVVIGYSDGNNVEIAQGSPEIRRPCHYERNPQ